MQRNLFTVLVGLLILPALLFAGTNGKIKGKVTDKENGEALPGANIVIEGTTFGAASDLNGEFVILNVPVGTYTLQCSFIGYRMVEVSNVRVNVDLTTEVNFAMPSEALELGAVEIVAERPLVNKNATNEVHIKSADEIKNLPVRGYVNVAGLSAGVVQVGGTLYIRGGRSEEVTYYVDGVYQNNPYNSARSGDLINNSIEEIQVQNGGFNAEYGFANSGLIHTTTKTGGSKMAISGEVITDEFLSKEKKNIGAYSYGYNIYNMSVSGPFPMSDKVKYFLAGERQFLRDRGVSSGGHPALVKGIPTLVEGPLPSNELGRWNWNGNFLFDFKPLQFKIGGNSTRDTQSFYQQGYSMFNADRMPRGTNNTDSYYVKATHTLGPKTFYSATGSWFRNEIENGDKVWFDNLEAYGNKTLNPQLQSTGVNPSTSDLEARFSKKGTIWNGYTHNKSEFLGLKADFTHQASGIHELQGGFEYRYNTVRNYSIAPMRIASLRELNPNLSDVDIYRAAYANNIGYDIFGKNEVNSGIDNARHPVLAAFYVQDKLEFKDLVLNLGVRYDYFDPATPQFADPTNIIITSEGLIDPAQLVSGKTYSNINPRVGMSFPVTDQTVFHAQYGKFTQQPQLNQLFISYVVFANNLQAGNFTQSGNPALQPVKTTAYEIGFRQQIGNNASLDITVFYKELRDLVQQRNIFADPVPYAAFINGDYGTVKGLSATFDLRRTEHVAATASYTLQFAGGTGSTGGQASNINWLGNPPVYPTFVSPLDYDQRHTLALNIDFRTTKDEGPVFLGGHPFAQAGLNLLFTMGSGLPYTPGHQRSAIFATGPNAQNRPQAAINSSYTPFTQTLDGKIDKSFTIAGLDLNVYLWVINPLGDKNVINVYDQTGSPSDDGYLNSAAGQTFASLTPTAADYYQARIDNPGNYGAPRQYRLGLRFDFR